ncbi:hypothetical protein Nepgr_032348 [Nepenthes gracilis]|uniref:Uncharacterized protein n=1 Tax=Nepenthes gracilis TaxID=150966 RepID=A0AAD3TJ42_NEPGR|nr:hypothetical protein Nepgr_032348 [Nepenthes gracilis]
MQKVLVSTSTHTGKFREVGMRRKISHLSRIEIHFINVIDQSLLCQSSQFLKVGEGVRYVNLPKHYLLPFEWEVVLFNAIICHWYPPKKKKKCCVYLYCGVN